MDVPHRRHEAMPGYPQSIQRVAILRSWAEIQFGKPTFARHQLAFAGYPCGHLRKRWQFLRPRTRPANRFPGKHGTAEQSGHVLEHPGVRDQFRVTVDEPQEPPGAVLTFAGTS